MGMFDEIEYEGKTYQTKDFEYPYLELYTIENNTLFKVHWDTVGDGFGGLYKERAGLERINYHGVINGMLGAADNYREYRFKFTNGLLESVEPIEDIDA